MGSRSAVSRQLAETTRAKRNLCGFPRAQRTGAFVQGEWRAKWPGLSLTRALASFHPPESEFGT